MIARRQIRVLLVYSKTFYFLDRGRQRGATYDFMRLFEDDLNRRLKTGHLRVQVIFIPVGRDELLPGLVEGRGDIAAANLTITDERREQVDFSNPIATGVSEIVVTGPGLAPDPERPGPLGPGGLRPQVEQLLREPAAPERGAGEGRQAPRPPEARPGDPRGRGPPRDGQRRPGAARRGRRPQGRVLGPGLPEDPAPPGRGRPDRRRRSGGRSGRTAPSSPRP